MKWLKNVTEEMNLLKDNKLSFVMVAPEASRWNEKAAEAAEIMVETVGDDATVAYVDPAVNADFCEAHEVMHQFTLLVFKGESEVERRRIGTLSDLKKALCTNLAKVDSRSNNPRRARICESELALGHTA